MIFNKEKESGRLLSRKNAVRAGGKKEKGTVLAKKKRRKGGALLHTNLGKKLCSGKGIVVGLAR